LSKNFFAPNKLILDLEATLTVEEVKRRSPFRAIVEPSLF
jgi:hypothetical protein